MNSTQASRVAIVVSDDDRRVERLKVEHEHRVGVERRLRFQRQRQPLRRLHAGALLHRRRHGHEVLGLGQTQHHRLDAELGASREHLLKVSL